MEYLDARELVTDVYRRTKLPLQLESGTVAQAWCYVARPDHEQFAGQLSLAETLRLVSQGTGRGGSNVAYVLSTVAHLQDMGITDAHLEILADRLNT